MPKNKTQGIVFGLIMSYSMAIGMEIYNNAIQQGVHLQPGGFTNLTLRHRWQGAGGGAVHGADRHSGVGAVGQPTGRKAGGQGV